jgi:hypothetical protein
MTQDENSFSALTQLPHPLRRFWVKMVDRLKELVSFGEQARVELA